MLGSSRGVGPWPLILGALGVLAVLGVAMAALVPGGSERFLRDGGEITITQSAVSLESLLGRFIFSVTEMNQQRGGDQPPQPAPAPAPAAPR